MRILLLLCVIALSVAVPTHNESSFIEIDALVESAKQLVCEYTKSIGDTMKRIGPNGRIVLDFQSKVNGILLAFMDFKANQDPIAGLERIRELRFSVERMTGRIENEVQATEMLKNPNEACDILSVLSGSNETNVEALHQSINGTCSGPLPDNEKMSIVIKLVGESYKNITSHLRRKTAPLVQWSRLERLTHALSSIRSQYLSTLLTSYKPKLSFPTLLRAQTFESIAKFSFFFGIVDKELEIRTLSHRNISEASFSLLMLQLHNLKTRMTRLDEVDSMDTVYSEISTDIHMGIMVLTRILSEFKLYPQARNTLLIWYLRAKRALYLGFTHRASRAYSTELENYVKITEEMGILLLIDEILDLRHEPFPGNDLVELGHPKFAEMARKLKNEIYDGIADEFVPFSSEFNEELEFLREKSGYSMERIQKFMYIVHLAQFLVAQDAISPPDKPSISVAYKSIQEFKSLKVWWLEIVAAIIGEKECGNKGLILAEFEENLRSIHSFLDQRKLDPFLSSKLQKYFRYTKNYETAKSKLLYAKAGEVIDEVYPLIVKSNVFREGRARVVDIELVEKIDRLSEELDSFARTERISIEFARKDPSAAEDPLMKIVAEAVQEFSLVVIQVTMAHLKRQVTSLRTYSRELAQLIMTEKWVAQIKAGKPLPVTIMAREFLENPEIRTFEEFMVSVKLYGEKTRGFLTSFFRNLPVNQLEVAKQLGQGISDLEKLQYSSLEPEDMRLISQRLLVLVGMYKELELHCK